MHLCLKHTQIWLFLHSFVISNVIELIHTFETVTFISDLLQITFYMRILSFISYEIYTTPSFSPPHELLQSCLNCIIVVQKNALVSSIKYLGITLLLTLYLKCVPSKQPQNIYIRYSRALGYLHSKAVLCEKQNSIVCFAKNC